MIEREMKFLIEREEFERLLRRAKELYPQAQVKVIEQTNYYYDTEDLFLFNNRTTLRVRKIGDKYIVQKKSDKSFKNGVRTAKETETEIDFLPESFSSAQVDIQGEYEFKLLGRLTTKRTRFLLQDGTKLDFDVSQCFGIEDYELEIELATESVDELLSELAVKNGALKGKYQRFLERYSLNKRI